MAELKQTLEELAGVTGQDRLKADPSVTARYAVDGLVPKAVAFPTNTRMVADVIRCAGRGGLSVVPWGSGTKMPMGNPPKRVDLVLCTARMNHMLDVDTSNLTITVEGGVKFRDIQARLATEEDRCYLPLDSLAAEPGETICSDRSHSGCFLPLDPPFGEKATIGGIVATNSFGPRRLLYGLPRDLVLGIRFVAANGEIVNAGGKTVKNVSGYDVSKLMIGSMGSLGILCEVTLRLLPLPEKMETLVFSFHSFSDASSFASAVLATKLLPAALEVANRKVLEIMDMGLKPNPSAYEVLVALEAAEEAVSRMSRELPAMAKNYKVATHAQMQESDHRLFWLKLGQLQEAWSRGFPDLLALRLNYPLSAWKTLFEAAENALPQHWVENAILCHAGSGVCQIHIRPDLSRPGARDCMIETVRSLAAVCGKAGGNLVIQRAPTDLKASVPVWEEVGPALPLMKRIREELDPSGILNPGRVV